MGSTPTDLSVDAVGDRLFVGHQGTMGLARIALGAPAFDKFVTTPRIPFEVRALSSGKVAVIDEDQWTTLTLLDGSSGAVLQTVPGSLYRGALTATADGNHLFVGESGLSGSNLTHFMTAGPTLVKVDESTYGNGYGFPYPTRNAVAVPDGSGVFYASYLLNGANLTVLTYPLADIILSVTPNGGLAISKTTVYHVANGAIAGQLPLSCAVQAVSPDGASLYAWSAGAITKVNLTLY